MLAHGQAINEMNKKCKKCVMFHKGIFKVKNPCYTNHVNKREKNHKQPEEII